MNRWLPRRQEAEDETFEVHGEMKSALVSHHEVGQWGLGKKDAMICSISHAWETREHPDPLRFQLQNLVNGLSLYDAAYFSEIWLFYDYVSLFQWQRTTTMQERSFRRAMGNMHLLYAHQSSLTFRLERLTPPDVWSAARHDETFRVPVYQEASGAVVFIPLRDLVENRADYNGRGWCIAEKEWAAARSVAGQNMVMDGKADDDASGEKQLTKKVPTAPDAFITRMASSEFTHRNDAKDVVHLQRKIFHDKVTVRKKLKLRDLTAGHMAELAGSLPHYQSLRVLRIEGFDADEERVIPFAQAEPPFIVIFMSVESCRFVFVDAAFAAGFELSAVGKAGAARAKRSWRHCLGQGQVTGIHSKWFLWIACRSTRPWPRSSRTTRASLKWSSQIVR